MKNQMTRITLGAIATLSVVSAAHANNLPPNAQPGECYTRIYVPAKFENRTEKVLVADGYEKIQVTAATFDTVTERVMVKAEGEKLEILDANGQPVPADEKPIVRTRRDGTLEIIPTAFVNVSQRIQTKEATFRIETIPATYETVTQRVLVKPAQTVWKPAKGQVYGPAYARDASGKPITRINNSTGEIMCLVQEPAQYRTIKKTVLKKPAGTRRVAVPAEFKTVIKRIPKKMTVRRVPTPAEYRTVTKRVLKNAAQEKRVRVEPTYETVQRRVLLSKGAVQWLGVLCDVNVTQDNVKSIQSKLRGFGFYSGPIDGLIGRGTMNAVTNFQKARGLVQAGITRETLQALGLSF